MGKKYIIEFEDEPFEQNNDPVYPTDTNKLYRAKGFNSLVFDKNGLDKLVPIEKVRPSWIDEWYHKGLEDAWECARKICTNWCISDESLSMIFGRGKTISDIMREHSPSEAIQKIKEWEEKKDEIKVGDEIFITENGDDFKAVVIDMDGDNAMWVINENGCAVIIHQNEEYHKTGRHFDEIGSVLSKMRGEEDE